MKRARGQFNDRIIRIYDLYDTGMKACRDITFQVTDACQLRCTYCYEVHKSTNFMSKETAKECVDLLFKMYNDNDPDTYINHDTRGIILEFIGGEPLLAIDVIDYTCEYFWMRCLKEKHPWADNFIISMTSNGQSYFDERVQNFIQKYHDRLSLSITIDGSQEMHDTCRIYSDGRGSWEKANAAQKHFHEVYGGGLQTKVTVAPENLKYFHDTVAYFLKEGYTTINGNPIYEHEWTVEEAQIYYKELVKMADDLLNNDTEDVDSNIFEEYMGSPMPEWELQTFCGGSGLMLAFDPKGNAYPCLRYMESSLGDSREPVICGNCKDGIYNTPETQALKENMDKITRRTQMTDECFYCPVNVGCGSCTAWCYQKYGTMDTKETSICWMHKARVLANAYFWNKYFRNINSNKRFYVHLPKKDALQIVDEQTYNELLELANQKAE